MINNPVHLNHKISKFGFSSIINVIVLYTWKEKGDASYTMLSNEIM